MKLHTLPLLSSAILAVAATAAFGGPLDVPVPGSNPDSEPCTPARRTDEYGVRHFEDDRSQSQGRTFDAVLFGDSITDFWVYSNLSFDGDAGRTINMGIGSDRAQNLLWRVRNGALDGYQAEYFTLMIGVNNGYQKHVDNHDDPCDRAEDVAESIRLILREIVAKHPESKILLMPILPYGFESRYYAALDVRNVNENVNDLIIKFVDNRRVFWVDLRGAFLNPDASCKESCYKAGVYDSKGHCLHPADSAYPAIWKPALTAAMQKYRAVPAGRPHVADPSLGYASAAPNADGPGTATITVRGIFLGTDAKAVPVASYSVAYELDGGPRKSALSNQTRTRNSFTIPDVALGPHSCKVIVATADGRELETTVDFTMTEDWRGEALAADGGAIRTDGALVCAYAVGSGTYTAGSVPFAAANGAIDDANIAWPYGPTSGSQVPADVADGGLRDLLAHCWWANAGEKEVTLRNLVPGHRYLVQIVGFRDFNGYEKSHVWIKESFRDTNYIKVCGDGWARGGVLTGTFTATAPTKTITVCADNNYALNAIQVRDLGK